MTHIEHLTALAARPVPVHHYYHHTTTGSSHGHLSAGAAAAVFGILLLVAIAYGVYKLSSSSD